MQVRDLIEKAIRHAGSELKLGKATGYTQNGIWQAKQRGSCSPKMALAIHRATDGLVPASDLRPDLWPTPEHIPIAPEHAA